MPPLAGTNTLPGRNLHRCPELARLARQILFVTYRPLDGVPKFVFGHSGLVAKALERAPRKFSVMVAHQLDRLGAADLAFLDVFGGVLGCASEPEFRPQHPDVNGIKVVVGAVAECERPWRTVGAGLEAPDDVERHMEMMVVRPGCIVAVEQTLQPDRRRLSLRGLLIEARLFRC